MNYKEKKRKEGGKEREREWKRKANQLLDTTECQIPPDFDYVKIWSIQLKINEISYILPPVFWYACLSSKNIFIADMNFRLYAKTL